LYRIRFSGAGGDTRVSNVARYPTRFGFSSLSHTILIFYISDINRNQVTVHLWVQKVDLQPTDVVQLNHAPVDESVIQLNCEQYWPYAAVDPHMNRLLNVRLYPLRMNAISLIFLSELYQVDNAVFLIDSAPWLYVACHRHGLRLPHIRIGMPSNISLVR
jgi:transposase-like protein